MFFFYFALPNFGSPFKDLVKCPQCWLFEWYPLKNRQKDAHGSDLGWGLGQNESIPYLWGRESKLTNWQMDLWASCKECAAQTPMVRSWSYECLVPPDGYVPLPFPQTSNIQHPTSYVLRSTSHISHPISLQLPVPCS